MLTTQRAGLTEVTVTRYYVASNVTVTRYLYGVDMTAKELSDAEGISLAAAKMRLYREKQGRSTSPLKGAVKSTPAVDLSPVVERLDTLQEAVETVQRDVSKLLGKAGEW